MSEKRLCINCFMKGPVPIANYTKYWCKNCLSPLCPTNCYDEHRKKKLYSNQSK